tara:strand:- start:45463 stop:46137 length:675 start_codon:yes stop_codon:yes gene_type:complete
MNTLYQLASRLTAHDPKFQGHVSGDTLHISYALADHAHVRGTLTPVSLDGTRYRLCWMGQVYPNRIPLYDQTEAFKALLEGLEWVHARHRYVHAPNLAQRRLKYLEALGAEIVSQDPRTTYETDATGIHLWGEIQVKGKYYPWERYYRWTDKTPDQIWGSGKALGELDPHPRSPSRYTEGWTALPDCIPGTATGILRVMRDCLQDIHNPPPLDLYGLRISPGQW